MGYNFSKKISVRGVQIGSSLHRLNNLCKGPATSPKPFKRDERDKLERVACNKIPYK